MKTPDYLSYDKYKNKKAPKRRMSLFIWTFLISLAAFLVLAQVMAPDVDVIIGDEPELEEKSLGLGVKQFVDSRLKAIDLDDLGKESLSKTSDEEVKDGKKDDIEEEKIVLPEKKENPITAQAEKEPAVMPAYEAPRPDTKDIVEKKEQQPQMIKVYVGSYLNSTQARVAMDILMDSGLDVSPFVKNLGTEYTLQIGSFTDANRAAQVAKELNRNGFPARLVKE